MVLSNTDYEKMFVHQVNRNGLYKVCVNNMEVYLWEEIKSCWS